MLKKILLILAGLAIVGGIAAAMVIFQPWGLIGWDRTPGMGNTNGNLQTGWPAVQDGEWVYLVESTLSNTITKMTIDGKQRQVLETGEGSGIQALNLAGNWLYYCGDGISKMRIDGSESQRICSDSAYKLHVVDGWCYYINSKDDRRIYRIRTNGTGRQRLSNLRASGLNVSDDGWIYFVNTKDTDTATEDWYIYRMRTNGSDLSQISQEHSLYNIQLHGEWIYYLNGDKDKKNHLYKMRTDGTEISPVISDTVYNFIVIDNWVYYNLREENIMDGDFKLHKIHLDGTEHQIISEEPMDYFSLIGDWVYGYTDPSKVFLVFTACRVRTDGTGWEKLYTK